MVKNKSINSLGWIIIFFGIILIAISLSFTMLQTGRHTGFNLLQLVGAMIGITILIFGFSLKNTYININIKQKKILILDTQKLFILSLIGIYVLIFLIASNNLLDSFLWYDEAGQFWIGKGLNHYSDPYQNTGGLKAVIENNRLYNLDPGGFSIILHFWSFASNSYIWLRALPYSFFIGTIIAFIYLTNRWIRKLYVGLLLGFLPFLNPTIIYYGFELRAFSMEYLGVLLGIIALETLRTKISRSRLFLWGLILSLFLTSRYSSIVIIFFVSVYVVFLIWKEKCSLKSKIILFLSYSTPILLSLFLVYFLSLRFQNPYIQPLFYLPYLSDNWKILLSIDSLIYLLFLLFLLVMLVLAFRNKSIILIKYRPLLFVTVTTNFFIFMLSFLGRYPWTPYQRWGLPFYILVFLCLAAFLGEILIHLTSKPTNLEYILFIIIIIMGFYIRRDYLTLSEKKSPQLVCLENVIFNDYQKIYIDHWASPEIRYLFEYGDFQNLTDDIYPKRFNFSKGPIHNRDKDSIEFSEVDWNTTQANQIDNDKYDLLIVPALSEYINNDMFKLLEGCSIEAGVYVQNNH